MWNMIWPLILIVGSNCFYNICTKSMPENVNTFGALTVTYLVGAVLSAILLVSSAGPAKAITEISQVNWTSFVLGLSVVGLEAGYVFLYRAGWKVNNGALTANICLAIALLVIGFLLYKETISLRQVLGIVVCGIGLFLINH
ncbi:MAG: EamA family transporter [Lachnospiraceae bacterium]|nr:EamA family transporter [Lachnospiraceae bacterium]